MQLFQKMIWFYKIEKYFRFNYMCLKLGINMNKSELILEYIFRTELNKLPEPVQNVLKNISVQDVFQSSHYYRIKVPLSTEIETKKMTDNLGMPVTIEVKKDHKMILIQYKSKK